MHRRLTRTLACTAITAGLLTVTPLASASPIDGGPSHTIFVVKDLGGGAYYNATNATFYAADTASATLISATTTGADLLAQGADSGRNLLLLINGAVLVPVQKLL
jgi:ABC-type sugar transport system substrate-binding protein